MQKNTKLYIAYGSNMNIEQMARRCPTAKVVASTWLEGYRLRFMGGSYSAVATIEPSEDDLVPVLVWEIQPSYGYPSQSYFDTIRDGYIAAGFDPKLLHQAVAENLKGLRIYG